MDPRPFFVVVLPIITIFVLGLLGRTRRLGFWLTIMVSLLATPLVGFILALASGPRRRRARRQ